MGPELTHAAAEEATLVARLAAGEHEQPMRALYGRYGPRLYGLGRSLLGDIGLAEELVQETFVRLWRSAGRFDPALGSVRTFIFTIARRVAVDLHRRPSSRPLESQRTNAREESAWSVSEDAYDQLLLGLDVRQALDSLSDKHRETLELYYERDLTQREIAARLGVPLGTVKTRAFHALQALKLTLEERGLIG